MTETMKVTRIVAPKPQQADALVDTSTGRAPVIGARMFPPDDIIQAKEG